MKKKSLILALATVAGGSTAAAQFTDWMPDQYSLLMQMEYESRHVFRGLKQADDTFNPSLELGYGDTYFGWDAYFPTSQDESGMQEHQLYAGAEIALPGVENMGFDIGTVVYDFPHQDQNRNHEFYGGLLFGNFPNAPGLQVSAYLRHDADVKHTILEPAIRYQHDFEGPQMLIPIRIQFDGYAGFLADQKRVNNYRTIEIPSDQRGYKDSYNYYGGSARIFFRIDPNATLGAGLHYADAINQDEDLQPRDNNLFWTVSLTMGF